MAGVVGPCCERSGGDGDGDFAGDTSKAVFGVLTGFSGSSTAVPCTGSLGAGSEPARPLLRRLSRGFGER